MPIGRRILNLLVTLDQFLFCLVCLGHSAPNETASAAAWRLEQYGHWAGRFFRPIIDGLFFLDPDHCRKSYENLMAGKHMPPDIRQSGA